MNYVNIKNSDCNVKHFLWNRTIFLFMLITTILSFTSKLYAQKNMWVGETYMCDATSAVMGLTSDVSWTTNGGYLSLSGSGFYRNVTVTQYFLVLQLLNVAGNIDYILVIHGKVNPKLGLSDVMKILYQFHLQI